MDSLDLIRAFREVATLGNFSRAARRLDISKATVSKYVVELEKRFGVRLLHRSTRSVTLTDAGQLLLKRSEPVLELVELARAELQGRASEPQGRLRIASPFGLASGRLPDLLAEFMAFYPAVSISLQMSNERHMAEDGLDLELCFGPVANENLIVRRLMAITMVVCASPSYWNKHGLPSHPRELARHDALTLQRQGTDPDWRFHRGGELIDVQVKSRLESTEGAPLLQVALKGGGVIYVPRFVVQPHIDNGDLVCVLASYCRRDLWLSAAYLQRRHSSAALRALLSFLQARLGAIDLPPAATSRFNKGPKSPARDDPAD